MKNLSATLLMLVLLGWGVAYATPSQRALVRPHANVNVNTLIHDFNLNVIEDYGSFVLVEDGGNLTNPQLQSVATVRLLPEWDVIRVVTPFSTTSKASIESVNHEGLYLIHFHGPIKSQWVTSLMNRGVRKIVQYLPNYTLLVDLPEGVTLTRNQIPAADWMGAYRPAFKVSQHIRKSRDVHEGDVKIMLLNNVNLAKTLQQLRDLGVSFDTPLVRPTTFVTVTAHATMEMIEPVSRLTNVVWIEPYIPMEMLDEVQDQIVTGNYTGTTPNGPGYKAWLTSVGLDDLSSVIVDVSDDGWDTGDTTVGNHHPDFDNAGGTACRVIYQVDLCSQGNHGIGGHGTINQSIVMGDGAGTGFNDPNGYAYGTGVAPTALGGHTRIFGDDGYWCGITDMADITAPAAANGAVIASNSWGAPTSGAYDTDSARYDELVRDADADPSNGLTPLTVVFAAGNSGPSAGQVGSPGTAKNVITSGASENVREDGQPDGCGDSNADSLNDITNFSSPGYADDGRIKPDAMAPGNHIQGAASQYSGFDGSSVCGGPSNDFGPPPDDAYWPTGQTFYTWSSGTSHSTPAMAGTAALIYKWFDANARTAPSPAMLKAIMIGTADDMAGGADGNGGTTQPIPNNRQGWGRVNIGNLTDAASKYYFDQGYLFTSTGQTHSPEPIFTVLDPTLPIKIVMVYTDAPGDPNASPSGGLANDLDLTVTVGADVYLGNNFSGGFSVTGGTPDGTNNIEAVYLPAGTANTFTLEVAGTNIAADAVPGNGQATDQDYALFIYNATNQSSAGVISMDRDVYNCSDTITVTVSDTDLQGTGTLDVVVDSTTEPGGETVTLTETGAATGVMVGTITTTSAAPAADGLLSLTDGDTITATYNDADDGTTAPRVPATVTDTAVSDCTAPVISNVQVINITHDSATVTWDTNEPATSLVTYGSTTALGSQAGSTPLVTAHSVDLAGLNSCTTYFFEVASTDVALNTAVDDNGGLFYTFETLGMFDLFADDVESGNPGWTPDSPWAIVDTNSHSATHAWTDSPGGDYAANANVSLTSSVIDLSGYPSALLTFWHDYAIELGYDYGYVEVSTDGGATWTTLTSYTGATAGWTEVTLDIGAYAGSAQFQVRFRLQSDGVFNYDGWYIDDVRIAVPVSCHAGIITLERDVYICSGDTINITVMDMDLNTDPAIQESVNVTMASTTESTPENVVLTEETTSSSLFHGAITTTANPAAADGFLSLTDGDTITATYNDADDGSGNPAVVTDTATAFCTPLTISNVNAVVNGTVVTITWDTNRDTDSKVDYDTTMPPGMTAYDPTMVSSHSVTLNGLAQCTTYYFSVTSTDQYGITATDDNGGAYYTFDTGMTSVGIYNSTDTPIGIPDANSTGVTSVISVPDNKTVNDVNVTITITHTWDSDLDIYLIAPDGTQVELSTDNGGMGDDYTNTVFDDEATTPITSGSAPFTGSFQPEQPLSTVDGISALGDWSLWVSDDTGGDTGTIESWSIELTYPPATCGPNAVYDHNTFTDSCAGGGAGDADGVVDPGEMIDMMLYIANNGTVDLTSISATLSTTTPGVTVTTAAASYSDLLQGAVGSSLSAYQFTVDSGFTCGGTIDFQLDITSDQGTWSDTFTRQVGVTPSGAILSEDFEAWPPTGWTILDNIASGHVWGQNPSGCTANRTPYGTGYAAAADSDCICDGSGWDTSLISPPIDLTAYTSAILTYESNFQDYAGAGEIWLDVTTDGGASWTNIRYQDVDDPAGGTSETEDLAGYLGSTIQLRWRYSDNNDGCAWYWHVDDVTITVSPVSAICNPCGAGGCLADLGDVNLNTSITSMDASLVLQAVVGLITLTPDETCRADVTESAGVTALDAAYILMCVVGNCPGLPNSDFQNSCSAHGNCP